MVQCPKCSTELDADFGMVTCPSCSSVVFIEFDGTAKIAEGTNPSRAFEPAAQIADQEPNLPEADLSAFDNAIADSLFAPGTLESQEVVNRSDLSQVREPFADEQSAPEWSQNETLASVSNQSEVEQNSEISQVVSPADPLGLSAYANSEISSGKDGPFLYNVFIDGLDSKEIRESLREVISDSRFSWDASQLLAQVKGGKLKISNVSPVQASILVNRLKRLPLSIFWEQHAITSEKF